MRCRTFLACILGFSFCSVSLTTAAELPAKTELLVRKDGSVELDGTRYTDAEKLERKLIEVKARHPKPDFEIVTQKGATLREIIPAYELLIKTGQLKVGFITEPRER